MLSTHYSLTAEVNRQTALESQIAQLQTDISSGTKVHVASDDPAAAARIATIGRQQADNTVYASNVSMAQSITSLVDTNLQSVQTALNRVKELALSASNGTMNDSDRAAVVTELQGIAQDLTSYSTQTDSSGNPLYIQGTTPTQIPIGKGITVAAGDSYSDVWGNVTLKDGSTSSIADIVNSTISAIQNNDSAGMATSLDSIDSATNHISDAQADIGVRETRLNNASDSLANTKTDLASERSVLEDTDATEAYATLSNKMTILNAAQSVLATLGKISLFDKIS
jgi:flagellar hook-associated protein 3 FlgL